MILETVALSLALTCSSAAAQPGELVERTLAIVGGQVITLSDVRTATALGLVESAPTTPMDAAVSQLVDRLLVLREVQRYLPQEPEVAQIESELDGVRRRFASPDLLIAVLEAGGFSETRLRTWIRDDLRIAAYLGQRFAAVGVPGDEEVSAYYASHREEFERQQLAFDAAAVVIRARLSSERRAQLIADWILELRRRTPILEPWKATG